MSRLNQNILLEPALLDMFGKLDPTHIYLSGGEPLIHPGIKNFVKHVDANGHILSIDTNIHLQMHHLEDLLSSWSSRCFGFINISHHFLCGISLEHIMQRARLIKSAGIPVFVKYVGVPEHLDQIEESMNKLREAEIGTCVTILQGKWKGRTLPEQYTLDESRKLLNLVTLSTHGLQLFGGVRSKNLMCRGGQDFITLNMKNDRKMLSCCHGGGYPLNIMDTFFVHKKRDRVPCRLNACVGDLMFIAGINGVTDETDRFNAICHGESRKLSINSVLDDIDDLITKGHQLVDKPKFDALKRAVKPTSSRKTRKATAMQSHVVSLNEAKTVSCADIKQFVDKWKSPEQLMRAHPQLTDFFRKELSFLPHMDEAPLTRMLAKKVVQKIKGLPRKANIETTAKCPLNCEFCTLNDLTEHRRQTRMTFDDFKTIWASMEPFTTDVEFTGGEPLLNPDVFNFIEETNKSEVNSTLTTNGFLLTNKRAERILNAKPTRIIIAYDSVNPENYKNTRIGGDLTRLRRNIANLVKRKQELGQHRPEINLQMVVNRKNKDEVPAFFKEAEDLGVDSASIKPLLIWPGSGGDFEKKMIEEYLIPDHPLSYHRLSGKGELVKDRKPGFCANTDTVHIGSGSEVIPCWYLLKDTFVAGYAADAPFIDIWFSDEYRAYRRRMKEGTVHEGCKGCIGRGDPRLFVTRKFNQKQISPFALAHQDAKDNGNNNGRLFAIRTGDDLSIDVPVVPVHALHESLRFNEPIEYPRASMQKPLEEWKMEIDDAPIFRYIYGQFKPRRHLEFGTWQGYGVEYCLNSSDASVWTINTLNGEFLKDGQRAYGTGIADPRELQQWAAKMGLDTTAGMHTDTLGFIGWRYLSKGAGNRVNQIYCDSRDWNTDNYPPHFFDTVLIDGGHTRDVVISDTRKSMPLLRSGGLMLWHDFCPPVYQKFEATFGVTQAVAAMWEEISGNMADIFWIKPSWLLIGVKK